MTVESNVSRVSFAGDDATTSFPLGAGFIFFDDTDLVVEVVTDAAGDTETLSLNVDYTVSGGDGATGTVDTSSGSSPHGVLVSGTTMVIRRVLPFTQKDDLVNGEIYDADVIETRLDKITMLTQQLEERVGRALRASVVETAIADLPTPVERRAKLFFFEDTVDANPSVASAGELGALVVLDEDGFASDSDEFPPSQQSTKVYTVNKGDFSAKGDLIAGTGSGAYARVPVGADGKVLKAKGSEAGGVEWGNATNTLAAKTSNYTLQSGDLASVLVVPIDISAGSVTITELALGSMSGIVIYEVVADDGADTSTKEAILNDSGASEVWTGVRVGDFFMAAYDGTNRRMLDHRESFLIRMALTADQSISGGSYAQLTGWTVVEHHGSVKNGDQVDAPFAADLEGSLTVLSAGNRVSAETRIASTKLRDVSAIGTDSSTNTIGIANATEVLGERVHSGQAITFHGYNHYGGGSSDALGDGTDETQVELRFGRLY